MTYVVTARIGEFADNPTGNLKLPTKEQKECAAKNLGIINFSKQPTEFASHVRLKNVAGRSEKE